ncbi:hypothetical protein NC796_26065 [Aliifodinibius sp. S!AR15-10]|uniref:hypothetical protein n=1 Tax=Aliifodinibius sp. S!AR15-10 TaxID=2950437 RepID=UPI0028568E0E|nr:hypothetical protein [Aliifodinibius sp. S!AR15-10]MDR8394637.1 hypothetical protein [Aliifodinibius sp. S!AR15-10]
MARPGEVRPLNARVRLGTATKGTNLSTPKRSNDLGSEGAAPAPNWEMGARRHEHQGNLSASATGESPAEEIDKFQPI